MNVIGQSGVKRLRNFVAGFLLVGVGLILPAISPSYSRLTRGGAAVQCLNFIAVGDSITQGFGATQPFPATIATALSSTGSNQGVGSAGWLWQSGGIRAGSGSLTALAAATVDPLLVSLTCGNGAKPYLLLFAGLNDIRDGDSAATAFTSFQAYYNARITAGWPASNIIVATLLNSGISNAQQIAYNNSVIAGAYNLARLDLDPNIGCNGCNTNPTYFQADTIHPTNAGLAIMANLFCNTMQPRVGTCPAY